MITAVVLQNYRRYSEKKIILNDHFIITGPNGFGKTTILEAIYWCVYGRSPLTTKLANIVNRQSLEDFKNVNSIVTAVELVLEGQSLRRVLEITKKDEKNHLVSSVYWNGKKTTQIKFQKKLYVGLFSPEYIEILGRDRRQRLYFIDALGKQIINGYTKILNSYNEILRNRNRLLKDTEKINQILLQTYTQRLVDYGKALVNQRLILLEKLTRLSKGSYPELNQYKYIYQEIKPFHYTKEILEKELQVKRSLLGPHLDDWEIWHNKKLFPVLELGSRGQKKIAILSLFLTIIEVVKENDVLQPIILMDDPTNELDQKNNELFNALDLSGCQVVKTCIGNA